MSKPQPPKALRRKYDEEFKNEAVRLVITGNRTVPEVARSLGISENLLYRWAFQRICCIVGKGMVNKAVNKLKSL